MELGDATMSDTDETEPSEIWDIENENEDVAAEKHDNAPDTIDPDTYEEYKLKLKPDTDTSEPVEEFTPSRAAKFGYGTLG